MKFFQKDIKKDNLQEKNLTTNDITALVLPDEVIEHILLFLPYITDFIKVAPVSSQFNKVVHNFIVKTNLTDFFNELKSLQNQTNVLRRKYKIASFLSASRYFPVNLLELALLPIGFLVFISCLPCIIVCDKYNGFNREKKEHFFTRTDSSFKKRAKKNLDEHDKKVQDHRDMMKEVFGSLVTFNLHGISDSNELLLNP